MTIDEMRQIKQEKGYSYDRLSKLSGVPVSTLQKIFRGETSAPRYDTLQALEAAFSGIPVVREEVNHYGSSARSIYKRQGEYTLDDYYAIPDDQRVELIDGVIYDMNAPIPFHQLAAGEIYRQISNFIIDREGDCMPFISPIDVQLDRDNRTMVQPDVIIMCDRDQILARNIFGAPAFVLEIISPSTKRKDYTLKLAKYEHAGVKEYWLVDPYQKMVIVYFFESDTSPTIYPVTAQIPVNLYHGELVIDLNRILPWLPKDN